MSPSLVHRLLDDGRLPAGAAACTWEAEGALAASGPRGERALRERLREHLEGPGLFDASVAVVACQRLGEPPDDLVAALDARSTPEQQQRSEEQGRRLLAAMRADCRDARLDRLARRPRVPQPVALGSVVAASRLTVDDAAELSLHGMVAAIARAAVEQAGLAAGVVERAVADLQRDVTALARRAARTRTPVDLPHDPAVVVELAAQRRRQHALPMRHAS